MVHREKQSTAWMAVLFTVCGGILLLALLLTLILRYRTVENELNRMLIESLVAHTTEAGVNAGEQINGVNAVLDAGERLIELSGFPVGKKQAERLLETTNLASRWYELSYLDRQDMASAGAETEEYALYQTALAGEQAYSGLLSDPEQPEAYLIVIRPIRDNDRVVGALRARLNADLLCQPEQHSIFFQNVHSAVAGDDGRIVYGSVPETQGLTLVSMGAENGITEKEAREFTAAYQADPSGVFSYDLSGGRCYVAWAPISFNGWRVVQFSKSTTVQIEHSTMLQTTVMLVSLAVCIFLAVLAWAQRVKLITEKLRYNTLSEFKDTLLFEYDLSSDSLEFTSNALDSLDMDSLRLENITDEAGSFPVFHPDDIGSVRHILLTASKMAPDQIEHDRVRLKKRDGEYSWYRSQYKAVFGADGNVHQVIGTLTDISAQIVREIELRKQAQLDSLTGIYNRAGVKLINARLEQISRGVLFMMDLDDFKFVNDNYGHAAGDQLLTAIGHVLIETFRTDDIVARIGGDEFVAFLSGSDNKKLAEQKAQELQERVRSLKLEGIDTQASVSIGAACAPFHGRTYEALSAVADEALYEVKKTGKGGFVLK